MNQDYILSPEMQMLQRLIVLVRALINEMGSTTLNKHLQEFEYDLDAIIEENLPKGN